MKKSFIHFNRRDIRLRFPPNPQDPWFSEYQSESDGFEQPRFHVTRAFDGPAALVEPGDTIWLVGQLYAPWGDSLAASLDARIDVSCVKGRSEQAGLRYTALEASQWFPLSDATKALQKLRTLAGNRVTGRLWKNRDRAIGHYLQRMRQLETDKSLREWEERLNSQPLHFISYRIKDGTQAAFLLAKKLQQQKQQVFWDRWSLPRRLAERREAVGDQPLDDTISRFIRQADVVWGIESPLYAQPGSYSVRERDLAKELGKYRAASLA